MGTSASGSDQQNSFNQTVHPASADWMQGLMDVAAPIMGQYFGNLQNKIPGIEAGMEGAANQANPAQVNQLGGGATLSNQGQSALSGQSQGGFGYDQGLMDKYTQGLSTPSASSSVYNSIMGGQGNNYADAMKNSMQQDSNLMMNNMMNNVDARMSNNDMSGSSRGDIMSAQGAQDINRDLQRGLTEVGYSTFDRNLNNQLNIAGMADQNQAANMRGMEDLMQGQMGSQNQAQFGSIGQSQNVTDARNLAQQFGLGNVGNQQQGYMNTAQPSFIPGDFMQQWTNMPSNSNPLTLASGSGSGSSSSKGASAK